MDRDHASYYTRNVVQRWEEIKTTGKRNPHKTPVKVVDVKMMKAAENLLLLRNATVPNEQYRPLDHPNYERAGVGLSISEQIYWPNKPKAFCVLKPMKPPVLLQQDQPTPPYIAAKPMKLPVLLQRDQPTPPYIAAAFPPYYPAAIRSLLRSADFDHVKTTLRDLKAARLEQYVNRLHVRELARRRVNLSGNYFKHNLNQQYVATHKIHEIEKIIRQYRHF